MPGKDLQGEEMNQQGLDIDYLFGKGLPEGAGGYINLEHDPHTIVGIPLEGKITPQGFWIKWKALKTPLMKKIIEQMKALKEAGWPRRYGMSVEGVVVQRDPLNPKRILRAFIRNVALTLTPVHPGTYVDFAKSLTAESVVQFRPDFTRQQGIAAWARTVAEIRTGKLRVSGNPYFRKDGRFRRDRDVAYFRDVHGMSEADALFCARYALSREPLVMKALSEPTFGSLARPRGHPHYVLRQHLQDWKRSHPECPHVDEDGCFTGGLRTAARHFYGCEVRSGPEVNVLLDLLKGSGLLKEE
ncbi:MAG: hypothetical protein K6T83_03585 [Alicyclobacillus sp.]|nr:hypothetical protein [Alicyclobacillus sp.]